MPFRRVTLLNMWARVREATIGLVGVFAGLLASSWFSADSRVDARSPGPTDVAALELRIEQLGREVETVRAMSRATTEVTISPTESTPSANVAPSEEVSPEEREAQADAAALAREELLDGLLVATPGYPTNEAHIREALGRYVPTGDGEIPALSSLRCTEAMCRVEFTHVDSSAVTSMLSSLSRYPGLSGFGFLRRYESHGGYRTIYFVSQDGERLPRPMDEELGL